MVSKVIGNLSADRLTKLSTEYKWMDVEEIGRLSALTDLELCIHPGDLEQDEPGGPTTAVEISTMHLGLRS